MFENTILPKEIQIVERHHHTLLKGTDVARILGVSKALAYRLMAQGDIPTVHLSDKTVRVRPEDLDNFIIENLSSKNSGRTSVE
jgi:predicted DNA-binding transcriptional regulator AlpA